MSTRRKAIPKVYAATREELYRASCMRDEPCDAHKDQVDKMIARLERMQSDES